MESKNEDDNLIKNVKQISDCSNVRNPYMSGQKDEIIFPTCRNFLFPETCSSSVPSPSMDLTTQGQRNTISDCSFSRQIVTGQNLIDNVPVPSDISLVNMSSNSPSNYASSVTMPVTPLTSVCEIMSSVQLPLQSALNTPVITKRGPGRPRKDGSGPIQRKKIFPGRPRMRTRKAAHRAIIPLLSNPNQIGSVYDGRSGYHLSDTSLHESKGYDMCGSSEGTSLLSDLHRSHSLELGDGDDSQPFSVMRRLLPDEPVQEQWSGKVCAFCNLGENSSLGQGELTRFEPTPGFNPFKKDMKSRRSSTESDSGAPQIEKSSKFLPLRRQKSTSKFGRERGKIHRRSSLYGSSESIKIQPGPMDELEIIGFTEEPDPSVIFEPTGHVYGHHCCAAWSEGVCQTEDYLLHNVDKAVSQGLSQRCSNCRKFGATIQCKAVKCNRVYHYPCATSCGTFQDIRSLILLCPQHLSQAPILCEAEATCMMCEMPGNISELLFCTNCGHHYHGSCLDSPVAVNPVVRAGWQCPDCKVCQTCRRQPEEDNKMLVCDTCDKGYHTFCLKPIMASIPKNGWKCQNCRICGDCGARTPGSGPSSRWHMNYTVCDSCYQQRNKGVACPLCGKAYRQFSQRGEMAQCRVCRKLIHGECDPRIDQYKDCGTLVPYICPVCSSPSSQANATMKEMENSARAKLREDNAISPHLENGISGSKESFGTVNEDSLSSLDLDLSEKALSFVGQPMPMISDIPQSYDPSMLPYHIPRHLPFGGKYPGKKRLGVGRPRGSGKFAGKRRAEFHRKRGPKPKVKLLSLPGAFSYPGLSIMDTKESKQDDEPTNKMVLCSATDEFFLSQDLCVMCGSYGRGEEGRIISCSQCGQCYHPYCVTVKVTPVILKKGWRCLDCTVCEGCGQPHDESRLLLCDDCDISYHTYCLDPPLDEVPQGNWKCKWCVVCVQCGERSAGYGSQWQNNYTKCGPCASEITCPVCQVNYQENDLVIQCVQCERWLHGKCDQMASEDDAEICAESGYYCVLCRSKDEIPPHLMLRMYSKPLNLLTNASAPSSPSPPLPLEAPPVSPPVHKSTKETEFPVKSKPQAQFYIDGVFLSESGMHQIKSLTIEQPKKQRMRRQRHTPLISVSTLKHSVETKNDDIEDVVLEMGNESETKMEVEDASHEEIIKPDLQDVISSEKKKRQRKLHKLGIGGFVARPRGRSLSAKDQSGELGSTVMNISSNEPGIDGQLCSDNIFGSIGETVCDFQFQEKPKRRRRVRRKNPLEDSYPIYLQEAFFGKDLLDTTRELETNLDMASEDENQTQVAPTAVSHGKIAPVSQGVIVATQHQHNPSTQHLSRMPVRVQPSTTASLSIVTKQVQVTTSRIPPNVTHAEIEKKYEKIVVTADEEDQKQMQVKPSEIEEKNSPSKPVDDEDLKDLLPLPQDLAQDDELMVMLMNDEGLAKQDEALDDITSVTLNNERPNEEENEITNNKEDPLAENIDSVLLSPHFNLDSMVADTGLPQMDSKDVEDIIKGVLSPADQSDPNSSSSNTNVLPVANNLPQTPVPLQQAVSPQHVQSNRPSSHLSHQAAPSTPGSGRSIGSPFSLPPPSPFPSEYGSPQLSEPQSPWLEPESEIPAQSQKNILKWESDEQLGANATISPVLYANINHPDLKIAHPNWSERSKQIAKLWRSLSSEKRQPYLQKARENRAASRMQKAQIEVGKVNRDQRSQREVDQEKQWKQFQAYRQHQLQKQQQILQEQRAQAILKAQQMALEQVENQSSDSSLSLSTSLPVSSTVSPNAVSSPRSESTPPVTSSTLSGSLNELCQPLQSVAPSAVSRSPSESGSPVLPQCALSNQQQPSHHLAASINTSLSQCSMSSQTQSPQQLSVIPRRTSTPVSPLIQVSRVRPPIDPSRLSGSDLYAAESPLLSSTGGIDSFIPPPRPMFVRQPVPQVRPVYPQSPVTQQLQTPRSEMSRPSTPTVVPEVFHTPPPTPHSQNSELYSQHSPKTHNQLHSQDTFPQSSTPHPVASPYSPSQSNCSSSVTPSPIEPYVQSPGTPTPRYSQELPFGQHLQHPQSTPVSPNADPYVQQPLTLHPASGLMPSGDVYNKPSSTPRPVVAPSSRLIPTRQISETGVNPSETQNLVPATVQQALENEQQLLARQQLRDLLQRQQLKKQENVLREQQGQVPLRHWPTEQRPEINNITPQNNSGYPLGIPVTQSTAQDLVRPGMPENFHRTAGPTTLLNRSPSGEDGFRHPYPPGMRPRLTLPGTELSFRHPSQIVEQRLVTLRGGPQEARLRMLMLQQQQQLQMRGQPWPAGQMRMPGPRMSTGFPNTPEQYENILQQRNQQLQQQQQQQQQQPAIPLGIEPIARFGQPAVCSTPTLNNSILNVHGGSPIPNNHNALSPSSTAVISNHSTPSFNSSSTASYITTSVPISENVSTISVISVMSTVSSSQVQPTTVTPQTKSNIVHTTQSPVLIHAHQETIENRQSSPKTAESVISATTSSQAEAAEKHSLVVAPSKLETSNSPSLDNNLARRKTTAGDLVKEVEEQAVEHETVVSGEVDEEDLDDDELLGLGNDFNILEYADPELDKGLVGEGEKSNILDEHLDLDDKDDELEEVEEMKSNAGVDKKLNNEIKREVSPEEEKKKQTESEDAKSSGNSQNELGNGDFQTKFLEFSQQRELEKSDETFEEENTDSNANNKIEEGDNKNAPKRISKPSTPTNISAEITSCQSISTSFPNVTTTIATSSPILPFSNTEQVSPLHISQQKSSMPPKSAIIPHTSPGKFVPPQVSLHREKESDSPSQSHFVDHLRIAQPPPYPANIPPPPPYQAHGIRPQNAPIQPQVLPGSRVFPNQALTRPNIPTSNQILPPSGQQERSLLQEQPLLLEDLVEQEKQEQRRQNQEGMMSPHGDALLSDIDFERLKADVFSGPPDDTLVGPGSLLSSQNSQPMVATNQITISPQRFPRPHPSLAPSGQQNSPSAWQTQDTALLSPCSPRTPGPLHPVPVQVRPQLMSSSIGTIGVHPASMLHGEPPVRANLPRPNVPSGVIRNATAGPTTSFAISSVPPPTPPSEPTTEQERQQQAQYEQWLLQQQNVFATHQKFVETEITKLRKIKKALNAKQRQLRKNNQELGDQDASELARISQEISTLQKQVDQMRKQTRQHTMLIQEYRMKQQKRQQQVGTGSPSQVHPTIVGMQTSPLAASHSPHRAGSGTPQSPMMSPSPLGPSPSPRMQHSPSPLMQNSPATMSPSPLMQQQSPLNQSQLLPQSVSHSSQSESGPRPHQVHVSQDDNNPFSESFQQREQLEKLQGHYPNTHQPKLESDISSKDAAEKHQNLNQIPLYGEENISFNQNHIRPITQPMNQVSPVRNESNLIHRMQSPFSNTQIKGRLIRSEEDPQWDRKCLRIKFSCVALSDGLDISSDLVGQPFPSLPANSQIHPQMSPHHSLTGSPVHPPPPPYPHHLRPTNPLSSSNLTSVLKLESNVTNSQSQTPFVSGMYNSYRASIPPPNITPYRELIHQEQNIRPGMLPANRNSVVKTPPAIPQKQIPTSVPCITKEDDAQSTGSQRMNQYEIDKTSPLSHIGMKNEQSNEDSSKERIHSGLKQQTINMRSVQSSHVNSNMEALGSKKQDFPSDFLQNNNFLETEKKSSIPSSSSASLIGTAAQESNPSLATSIHSSYSTWISHTTSNTNSISLNSNPKISPENVPHSLSHISEHQQKIDTSNKLRDENTSSSEDDKQTTTIYTSEAQVSTSKSERSGEKDWAAVLNSKTSESESTLNEDSLLENEHSNSNQFSLKIKKEEYISNLERQIENEKSSSPGITVIKDEPVILQGVISSQDTSSSSKSSMESITSRCSLSHTLAQSLPSSVTNTLNFTLRQTGMPTVCLPPSESNQLVTTDKSQPPTPTASEISTEKPQISPPHDSCSGIPQSNIITIDTPTTTTTHLLISGSTLVETSNTASPVTASTEYRSTDTKSSPVPQKTIPSNITFHAFQSSNDSVSDADNVPVKIEQKETDSSIYNVRTFEIKKEKVDSPSCQLSSTQKLRRCIIKKKIPNGFLLIINVTMSLFQGEEITSKGNEEIIIDNSINLQQDRGKTGGNQNLLHEESKVEQQNEPVLTSSSEVSTTVISCSKTPPSNECIRFEQRTTDVVEERLVKTEETGKLMKDAAVITDEKEINNQESVDNINQNVLLKQLLQNCPSAETQRKADHFEEFISVEGNKLCPKDTVLHDDREKLDDPRLKKLSYLDIRRAQLEKEPTPPPEELKPKRKRIKKKKPEGKDISPIKKRNRKGSSSKAEEDYETYMETMMTQLRSLPPLKILEPKIKPNFTVCPIFGSGDLNVKETHLRGGYGTSFIPTQGDFYSTYPYGSNPPTPPASLPPTPPPFRSFYTQDFSHRIRERGRMDVPPSLPTSPPYSDSQRTIRDSDSPDTIISSSSPECMFSDPMLKWPGLQLIDEDDEANEERKISSPVVPIVAPIPIRPVPCYNTPPTPLPDYDDEKDKENLQTIDKKSDMLPFKVKMVGMGGHTAPLKDSGNVAVTLTLSSAAAEDIGGVLSALANLLKISPPTSYEIVERTATPPSQKLGLYKKCLDSEEAQRNHVKVLNNKIYELLYTAKDTDVNIQTLLNGKPRFCRHCDIVVLTSGIRKKASDLLISSREEVEEDEVIFCSSNCYMQFALTHRSSLSSSEKEAAAVVSHLSDVTSKDQTKSEEDKTKICDKTLHFSKSSNNSLLEKKDSKDFEKLPIETTILPKEFHMPSRTILKQPTNKCERDDDISVSVPPRECSTDEEQHILPESTSDEEQTASRTSSDIRYANIEQQEPPPKKWKDSKWKFWSFNCVKAAKYRGPSEEEMGQILDQMNICIKPEKSFPDTRRCVLCHEVGDGETNGPARILNMDVDKWIHLNCALWSAEVYETLNGALINVDTACKRALSVMCCRCHKYGASLKCLKVRCSNTYHFPCAMRDKCAFLKDKTMLCPQHLSRITNPDQELDSVAVYRRVYVNRDEHKQVASMIHQGDQHLIRIGSLIFLNIGQLLPHQMPAFHTPNCIYPVGYKVVRMYWSMRCLGKRCQYICSICEIESRPVFRIQVHEKDYDDMLLNDVTPKGVWQKVLEPIEKMRKQAETIKVFPNFISGEDLFGLTEPAILRILESLPGVDTLSDYNFKYGRSPFLELPLAINPTGCARTEPKLRTHFKRPHTLHTSNTSRSSLQSSLGGVEVTSPYIKQFVHSKSSQYRKMKTEWRNNVYLARSHIQGLGLYAARDIEKHTMVIEYIGQLIRNEIAERNEAIYESQNRGVYMFRLDENRVIDATLCGGLARYMNHSCNPNCVAEVVQIDRENKILIIANRRITRGEELTYDYKFEVEDDQHKIPCLCGAPNCRKWMN